MNKYRLPEELPLTSEQHRLALQRGKPMLTALICLPVAGYFWQGFADGSWGWGLAGVAMSVVFGFMFWHAKVTGSIRTNHGHLDRQLRPFGYWAAVAICLAVYVLSVAELFLLPWLSHR